MVWKNRSHDSLGARQACLSLLFAQSYLVAHVSCRGKCPSYRCLCPDSIYFALFNNLYPCIISKLIIYGILCFLIWVPRKKEQVQCTCGFKWLHHCCSHPVLPAAHVWIHLIIPSGTGLWIKQTVCKRHEHLDLNWEGAAFLISVFKGGHIASNEEVVARLSMMYDFSGLSVKRNGSFSHA